MTLDILVTYLPSWRFGDVERYFSQNVSILNPKRIRIYTDKLSSIPTEYKFPFTDEFHFIWQILKDLKNEDFQNCMIVDSDNVFIKGKALPDLPFFTVWDVDGDPGGFRKRGNPYPIYKSPRESFFFGPKQGIFLTREIIDRLDFALLKRLENTLGTLDNKFMVEIPLGILFYYSGIREVPWVLATHHYKRRVTTRIQSKKEKAKRYAELGKRIRFLKAKCFSYWLRYEAAYLLRSLLC
jgi:hypothetical protein